MYVYVKDDDDDAGDSEHYGMPSLIWQIFNFIHDPIAAQSSREDCVSGCMCVFGRSVAASNGKQFSMHNECVMGKCTSLVIGEYHPSIGRGYASALKHSHRTFVHTITACTHTFAVIFDEESPSA